CAFLPLAQAQDAMPASTRKIDQLVSAIASQLASVEMLKDAATRQGAGIKASCLAEKSQQLQVTLSSAKNIQGQWASAEHNPAYAARLIDRVNVLELSANSYAADAKGCSDS